MTVADDIAVLRRGALSPKEWKALDRVEAEIARLERERGILYRANQKQIDLVRAAEAEVARLRDGLRNAAEGEEHLAARAREDIAPDVEAASIHSHAASVLRALLAEDGAARVCPNCGRKIRTETCEACAMPLDGAS